jgi:hypothetical protein
MYLVPWLQYNCTLLYSKKGSVSLRVPRLVCASRAELYFFLPEPLASSVLYQGSITWSLGKYSMPTWSLGKYSMLYQGSITWSLGKYSMLYQGSITWSLGK